MSTQLERLIEASGSAITLSAKTYLVTSVIVQGNVGLASFHSPRAVHTGVLCPNVTVFGRPGAEVWMIVCSGRGRKIAELAVREGKAHALVCGEGLNITALTHSAGSRTL